MKNAFHFMFKAHFVLNPLSTNPTKWSKILQFVDNLPTNCLSVFDHIVGLALKGLRYFGNKQLQYVYWQIFNLISKDNSTWEAFFLKNHLTICFALIKFFSENKRRSGTSLPSSFSAFFAFISSCKAFWRNKEKSKTSLLASFSA